LRMERRRRGGKEAASCQERWKRDREIMPMILGKKKKRGARNFKSGRKKKQEKEMRIHP